MYSVNALEMKPDRGQSLKYTMSGRGWTLARLSIKLSGRAAGKPWNLQRESTLQIMAASQRKSVWTVPWWGLSPRLCIPLPCFTQLILDNVIFRSNYPVMYSRL